MAILLEPKERIIGLQVERNAYGPDQTNLLVGLPKYWCPTCDDITPFKPEPYFEEPETGDENPDFTNLRQRKRCESISEIKCRICGRSARIYYEASEFAMACYKYYAIAVVEDDNLQQTPAEDPLRGSSEA